jgi:hypothetical protein
MKKIYFITAILIPFSLFGQTVGFNSPTVGANDATLGTLVWTNPMNIVASEDIRANTTAGQQGITQYLKGTGFGFILPAPCPSCVVTGVEAQIERSSPIQPDVAILNAWVGFTPSATGAGPYNFAVTAAAPPLTMNRALVVVIGSENGPSTPAILPPLANNDSRDVISVTYGGVPMIQGCEVAFSNILSGTTFWARNEIWFLNDAGISAAVGTNIVINAPGASNEYVQFVSAVSFKNVDQIAPIFDFRTDTVASNTNPFTLSNPAPMLPGSCAITSIVCGNPGSYLFGGAPAGASGLAGVTFVEGTDANGSGIGTSYSTSTATMMTGNAIVPGGSPGGNVAPIYNFSATPNRQVISMICVQRARDFDNAVRLVKAGTPIGTNMAAPTTWPLLDAYAVYGGAGNMWGTTVTLAEATNAGFGVAVSARVQNTQVRVDHMKILLYLTSTLPVELVDFNGHRIDRDIKLVWTTETENNNDYFELHRSTDAIDYKLVATIDGAGNSNSILEYIYNDQDAPIVATNYYKIKQVDFDGAEKWYGPIAVAPGQKENALLLYPNPATTTINIKNLETIDKYVVYNNQGEVVKSGMMENDNIDINDLPVGMYFLTIGDSGQKVKFMKF